MIGSEPSWPERTSVHHSRTASARPLAGRGCRPGRAARRCSWHGHLLGRPAPGTLVSFPAVIAWTTSCSVVSVRLNSATFWPSRSTVMLSATSKMSCRLCEIRTTPSPCSARRLTRSSTWRVWATPSAAVGSSRITSCEFHITALATATDWRCPPESPATVWRTLRIVVTDRLAQRLARASLHLGLVERAQRLELLAAEEHVLDDVEVVRQREVLVDDLDAEVGGVARAVDAHLLAVVDDLAAVDRGRCRRRT